MFIFFFAIDIQRFHQSFSPAHVDDSQEGEERKVSLRLIFGFKHVLNLMKVNFSHGDIQRLLGFRFR